MLERHWTTKSRTKLNNDLKGILKQVEQGRFTNNIGTLINEVKNINAVTGKQRNSLKPQVTDYILEPLLSAAEAETKLKDIVQEFFTDKLTRFINFSAGAGKTYTLIKYLDELNPNAKILYLVKTHQLADEITETFKKVREERLKQVEFKEKISSKSGMIAMKGRNMLCVNQTVKEKYKVDDKENAIPIHADQCSKEGCHLVASCAYIDQFNTVFQGIRVMMFNEYFNMPARWFNGVDEEGNPAKRKWQPDFIIIDENIIDKDDDWDDKYGRFKTSIDKIIHEVENGEDLADTIIKYRKEVCLDDDENNPEDKPITFHNTDQYIKELAEKKSIRFSPILRQLAKFAKTEDKSLLKGMRVENGSIVQSRLKLEAGRYQNIPTLYLDATANKEVVKHLLPNIQFHSIQVKAKSDINVYQLANTTLSISKLEVQKTLNQLINGLKRLIIAKGYSNVGLISYKSITGISGNFARYLAGELGIKLFEHFGNLRGVNKFSDVDCLIIAGRYSINPIGIKQYAYAVFGDCNEIGTHHENRLVRMKDGSANLINCDIRDDPHIEAIYDHFSASETKQAIGRGRLIHGKPKDIYYLANESIGTDIEITGFIYKDDIFYQPLVTDEYWVTLIETGFIRDNQPDLMSKFGWDKNKLQNNRAKLKAELIDAGFEYCSVSFTDKNRNHKDWDYFAKDLDKLKAHLVAEGIKNPKIELKAL
ncbi:MAG: DEAD/DEAH box helicase family protein [Methylovulum sp.]|nr:DEAD/DEAH box helicase family protein [Methylovulum sp.]